MPHAQRLKNCNRSVKHDQHVNLSKDEEAPVPESIKGTRQHGVCAYRRHVAKSFLMQRLLITGGTGYLGNALVKKSHTQGFLIAASYYSKPLPVDSPPDVNWLPLDVCDQASVEDSFDLIRPDVVIHTAFQQQEPAMWPVTAAGTRNVARAAGAMGVRMIHLSSDVIFDGERAGAYNEEDQANPITSYGVAKTDAEQFVLEHCTNMVIVRTSLIYGFHPIDRHTQFVLDIAHGLSDAKLFKDEYRCPVFVGDLAAALLELTQHPYRGVLHIAGADCLSRYDFGVLLAQFYGHAPSLLGWALSSEQAVRRPRNCMLDIQRASRILQTPLRGVRDVLELYRVMLTEEKRKS